MHSAGSNVSASIIIANTRTETNSINLNAIKVEYRQLNVITRGPSHRLPNCQFLIKVGPGELISSA